MSKLVVVESPAKAKTIGKYLGRDFHVVASIGHVRDLPKSNKRAIDLEHGFKPHYEISPGKEKVVAEISRLAKRASEVLLATDPDREGEAIAWHIAQVIGLDEGKNQKSKVKRVSFHEITEEAIKEALEHPRAIDTKLRHAQEARRVLDRLFGYDLSGLIWKKLRYGLSAGRVQSPALRLLAEREREIKAFVPEKFWVIEGDFKTKLSDTVTMTYAVEPKTQAETDRVTQAARASSWQVGEVTEEKARRSPRAPFTTSTLQQAASSRLGYSPSVTMRLAQRLYEAGHITYMRTDSTNLSAQALGDLGRVVESNFGANYYRGPRQYTTRSKNAQEAHEAIRPTRAARLEAGLGQEGRLYKLIWTRAVASQMVEAEILKTKITAKSSDASLDVFAATGQRVTFDGWLLADKIARNEENELPKASAGEPLTLADLRDIGKETQPPNRYSEAGLVKELEKRGIGRPSTYASIIKTIIDRGYVEKVERSLRPTDLGLTVSAFLEENFASYISDTFTAKMEDELDEIARGERDYEGTLKEFYGPFTKAVASKAKIEKINNLGEADPSIRCPVCGGPMVIKLARNGKFLSCAKFPECKGARTEDGKELEGPKRTGEKCPDCDGDLIEREGRYGKFIACANYPKCKFVKKDTNGGQMGPNDTNVPCPVCKKGTMIEKHGRYGSFYSCSNYPACKNAIKAKPTGEVCKMCGSLMMEGTKTIPERCSNKACANHNPHKLKT